MTGIKPAVAAIGLALLASPLAAQEPGVLERLRALSPPPIPGSAEIYADDIAADLSVIAAEAGMLFSADRPGFGPGDAPVRIVLFTGPDCPECAAARDDLAALAERLGIRASVIDIGQDPADAALMDRLSLDMLPSYAMPDRMIRGTMPAIVLEGYLTP